MKLTKQTLPTISSYFNYLDRFVEIREKDGIFYVLSNSVLRSFSFDLNVPIFFCSRKRGFPCYYSGSDLEQARLIFKNCVWALLDEDYKKCSAFNL